MAKIDTSKIGGYAEMTAEQKLAALEAYEFDGVSKETFDKTAAEAAENKRKLREALNQAGNDKAANDEVLKALQGKVAEMEKREKVADYAASLMDQGYSKELAKEVATAMADGDMATVFAKQQTFLAEREKQIRADALKKTPPPSGGGNEGGNDMTLKKLRAMSPTERYKFAQEHPDIYKELYNGG